MLMKNKLTCWDRTGPHLFRTSHTDKPSFVTRQQIYNLTFYPKLILLLS